MSAEGAQLAESGAPRQGKAAPSADSPAASRASTPAMGLSRSPRPPPLVILLLVLPLWLPLGAGKCHSETLGAVGQMAVRVLSVDRAQVAAFWSRSSVPQVGDTTSYSRKPRVSERGWFPTLYKSMD